MEQDDLASLHASCMQDMVSRWSCMMHYGCAHWHQGTQRFMNCRMSQTMVAQLYKVDPKHKLLDLIPLEQRHNLEGYDRSEASNTLPHRRPPFPLHSGRYGIILPGIGDPEEWELAHGGHRRQRGSRAHSVLTRQAPNSEDSMAADAATGDTSAEPVDDGLQGKARKLDEEAMPKAARGRRARGRTERGESAEAVHSGADRSGGQRVGADMLPVDTKESSLVDAYEVPRLGQERERVLPRRGRGAAGGGAEAEWVDKFPENMPHVAEEWSTFKEETLDSSAAGRPRR
jgi:hypothetical protein